MEVLQIILEETKGTFWSSECSVQHMLKIVNSTVGKNWKQKIKDKICLI